MRTSFWDPGAVGRLDSFEAESKRSWFTIRETLTAAVGGGRLWVPASVVLGENQLQVLINEGSLELRPRRLVWTEPNSFRVTGLSRGLAFRRSYLRFKTPEEASLAASIIKRSSSVLEEPLVPVEEFPVEFRLLLSAKYVIALVYVLFVSLAVGLFLLRALGALGNIGFVVGTVVLIVYAGLPLWAMLVKARRTTQGWIRIQGKSITVRSLDWIPVYPETIEWKSPQVIVLRGHGISYELSFLTAESLARAVAKIRTAYPGVQETLAETYRQDSR